MCSLIALAIVVGNVTTGVPPLRDEGASAHLFQLLMTIQVKLIIGIAATSDWKRAARQLLVLVAPALAFSAAVAALAWSGY